MNKLLVILLFIFKREQIIQTFFIIECKEKYYKSEASKEKCRKCGDNSGTNKNHLKCDCFGRSSRFFKEEDNYSADCYGK